jgi:hypothetical protein
MTGLSLTAGLSSTTGLGSGVEGLWAGFTGLSEAGSDPDFSSVVLLSGFEGVDGSTSFVDESSFARPLTALGSAQVDTAQKKFGLSSALFDGSNDQITAADSADFVIGGGAFTIEFFVRFAVGGAITAGFCGQRDNGSNANSSFMFYIQAGTLNFRYFSSGSLNDSSTAWSPAANTWYHLCVERAGPASVIRIYLDGVMFLKDTSSVNGVLNNSSRVFVIGSSDDATTFDLNGWIDEFRFTNGVARYNSDSGFPVPTAPYPRS